MTHPDSGPRPSTGSRARKAVAILLLALFQSAASALDCTQTEWTEPGAADPVRRWEGSFTSAGNVNWQTVEGGLVLDYQAVLMGLGGLGEPAAQVECGDVDGDGDGDLVVMACSGKILYFENMNSGMSFSAHAAYLPGEGPAPARIALQDLDGDGDLEIAVRTAAEGSFWLEDAGLDPWTARGVSDADPEEPVTDCHGLEGDGLSCLCDLDGDGIQDIVVADPSADRLYWCREAPGGRDTLLVGTGVIAPDHLDCADFDSDGDMDICAVSSAAGETAWWENLGGGRAFSCHSAGVLRGISWCSAGDLDCDGAPEIAVCSGTDGSTGYWEPMEYAASGNLVSSILFVGPNPASGRIQWSAETPPGTSVRMYVRLSDDRTRMGEWRAVSGGTAQLDGFLTPGSVFFQYKIELQTSDFGSTPTVTEVRAVFQNQPF